MLPYQYKFFMLQANAIFYRSQNIYWKPLVNYFVLGFLTGLLFPCFHSSFSKVRASPYLIQHNDSGSDSIRTEKQYFSALYASDEKTFRGEFELEFLLLLDGQQKARYDSLTVLEARKAFIEHYWKAANPNPLLPENDWLKDYLRRRAHARENFAFSKPPYYDDRGKYYIKYGKPTERYQDGGGLYPNVVLPSESWSYRNIHASFVVHFAREGITFREIQDLTDLILTGRSRQDIQTLFVTRKSIAWMWVSLVEQRAFISPVMEQTLFDIQWLQESIKYSQTSEKFFKL